MINSFPIKMCWIKLRNIFFYHVVHCLIQNRPICFSSGIHIVLRFLHKPMLQNLRPKHNNFRFILHLFGRIDGNQCKYGIFVLIDAVDWFSSVTMSITPPINEDDISVEIPLHVPNNWLQTIAADELFVTYLTRFITCLAINIEKHFY